MWRIRILLEFAFKKNIIIISFALIMGFAIYNALESLLTDVIIPFFSTLAFGEVPKELFVFYEKATDIEIRFGLFIQSVICFVIITVLVLLFFYIYRHRQTQNERKLESQVKPTFRDGVNLEIRDYLKYLPQIKDVLKNKEQ